MRRLLKWDLSMFDKQQLIGYSQSFSQSKQSLTLFLFLSRVVPTGPSVSVQNDLAEITTADRSTLPLTRQFPAGLLYCTSLFPHLLLCLTSFRQFCWKKFNTTLLSGHCWYPHKQVAHVQTSCGYYCVCKAVKCLLYLNAGKVWMKKSIPNWDYTILSSKY